MDKANIADKIGRFLETKITALTCPRKSEHKASLGRVHEPCGELIPFGPFGPAEYERFFGRPSEVRESGTSPEVTALWSEYEAADAERARLEGELLKNDREHLTLRGEAYSATFKNGNRTGFEDAPANAKIRANRARREELVEARDAAVERSEKLIRERSRLEAREAAERRRLESAAEPAGFIERAARALGR